MNPLLRPPFGVKNAGSSLNAERKNDNFKSNFSHSQRLVWKKHKFSTGLRCFVKFYNFFLRRHSPEDKNLDSDPFFFFFLTIFPSIKHTFRGLSGPTRVLEKSRPREKYVRRKAREPQKCLVWTSEIVAKHSCIFRADINFFWFILNVFLKKLENFSGKFRHFSERIVLITSRRMRKYAVTYKSRIRECRNHFLQALVLGFCYRSQAVLVDCYGWQLDQRNGEETFLLNEKRLFPWRDDVGTQRRSTGPREGSA